MDHKKSLHFEAAICRFARQFTSWIKRSWVLEMIVGLQLELKLLDWLLVSELAVGNFFCHSIFCDFMMNVVFYFVFDYARILWFGSIPVFNSSLRVFGKLWNFRSHIGNDFHPVERVIKNYLMLSQVDPSILRPISGSKFLAYLSKSSFLSPVNQSVHSPSDFLFYFIKQ